jgi:Dehydrogenases with different specificities (related to short-chain alcohol dehydrogenases)
MAPDSTDPNPVPINPLAEFRLDGQVALVTGASSGLGARFARVLDAVGARVAIAARRADRLEQLAVDLTDPIVLPCDLTDEPQRDALVPAVMAAAGRLDVLVNNAGRSDPMRALDESVDHFRDTVELNLVAPFAIAQACARAMAEHAIAGRIVNIVSIYALAGVGRVPEASYSASKGGLLSLTRELASQWSRRNIRVNALAPGWFPSEMTTEMWDDPQLADWIADKTPLRRTGAAHELDGALLFLASEASSYVTGQVLAVDGGWTAI